LSIVFLILMMNYIHLSMLQDVFLTHQKYAPSVPV